MPILHASHWKSLGPGRCTFCPILGPAPNVSKAKARELLELPQKDVIVGFLGYIRPGKGFPLLVEALEAMQRRPFWLVVAGKPMPGGLGPLQDEATAA